MASNGNINLNHDEAQMNCGRRAAGGFQLLLQFITFFFFNGKRKFITLVDVNKIILLVVVFIIAGKSMKFVHNQIRPLRSTY